MKKLNVEYVDIFGQPVLVNCSDLLISADESLSLSYNDFSNQPISTQNEKKYYYNNVFSIAVDQNIPDVIEAISISGIDDGLIVKAEEREDEIYVQYAIGATVAEIVSVKIQLKVHVTESELMDCSERVGVFFNDFSTPIYTDAYGQATIDTYGDLLLHFVSEGYIFNDYHLVLADSDLNASGNLLVIITDEDIDFDQELVSLTSFTFYCEESNRSLIQDYYVSDINQIQLQEGEVFELSWCLRFFVKDRSSIKYSSANEAVFTVSESGRIETKGIGEAQLSVFDEKYTDNRLDLSVKVIHKALRLEEIKYKDVFIDEYTFKLGNTYSIDDFTVIAGFYLNGEFIEDENAKLTDFMAISLDNKNYLSIVNDGSGRFQSFSVVGVGDRIAIGFQSIKKDAESSQVDAFSIRSDFTDSLVKSLIRKIYPSGNITQNQLVLVGAEGKTLREKSFSGNVKSLKDFYAMPHIDALYLQNVRFDRSNIEEIRQDVIYILKHHTDSRNDYSGNLKYINLKDGTKETSLLTNLIDGDNYSELKDGIKRLHSFTMNYMSDGASFIENFEVSAEMEELNVSDGSIKCIDLRDAKSLHILNAKGCSVEELFLPDDTLFEMSTDDMNFEGTKLSQEDIEAFMGKCYVPEE